MSSKKIKIYNKATGQWEIISASDASNISLSNPSFVDENNLPVSVHEGFTKISNKVNQLTQDIAYVYLHGGVGGGGGGGGTTEPYKLECLSGENIYTTKASVDIDILITSAGIKKQFTIVAKDTNNNRQLGTWKKYSMTKNTITISGLEGNTSIELTAYDASDTYTNPVYIKVIAGAIKLELQKVPNKTIYIGAVNDNSASYYLTNNIEGSPATFILEVNGKLVDQISNITTANRSMVYSTREIIFGGLFENVQVGQRFNFNAYAYTTLNGEKIYSNYIKYDITVADSERLIIVTDNISEFVPSDTVGQTWEDLTSVMQGQQLTFKYYLSCGKAEYNTFNLDYKIFSIKGTQELIDSGTITNVKKGESFQFIKNTSDLPISASGEYFRIELYGYAINDPSDVTAQYTKNVYFKVAESSYVELKANNDAQTLLAYYSKFYFPNDKVGNWLYKHPTIGEFVYNGAFKEAFKNGVNLVLKDVNGVTSGFIPDTDKVNQIPGIVLKGEAYGYIEVANYMFPNKDINDGFSFFQASGFNISITYKVEESIDDSDTILSIGSYREDQLWSGFEITQKQATVKIGSANALVAKLSQKELTTIDLDVSYFGNDVWYFKLYVDGIMTQVARVETSDIDWKFNQDLYIGCRYNNGIKSNFSNVTIYDLKLYTSSQNEYSITQNRISAFEQAKLIKGEVDKTLDAELREKEFFLPDGSCLIWDKRANEGKGGYRTGSDLYDKMITQAKTGNTYAVVLIEETSLTPTLYKAYNLATFPASSKDEIMNAQFPCKITYVDSKGELIISTPAGVPANQGVRVSIQGTSTLSLNAKNEELYLGNADVNGTPLLAQMQDDWLPENRFTLKADVMDSAHVNNVVIGQVINGKYGITPFQPTPPMNLPNNIFPSQEKATEIMSKIKHTSEGFPCLLFIKFAPDKDGNIDPPKFCGIYNFNLGRHAYFNLGMKVMTDYEREKPNGPTLVTKYSELPNYWNNSSENGMYSLEIQQNDSAQGAFQQDDPAIMRFMADVVFTSKDREAAYTKCQQFYTQMANMALTKIPKYTMTDDGQSPTKPKEGFYNLDLNAYYNFSQCTKYLNWNNACAYYVVGLLFGMVDSMCKNLTLRNWGSNVWYTSFYDMDTGNGLNNSGQDTVSYYAHLHRWYNVTNTSGNTTFTQQKNYPSAQAGDDYTEKQDFASYWNRIWEVVENLMEKNPPSEEEQKALTTIEKIYVNLRTNLFPDPEAFIDKYYRSYTSKTGSIVYNYDYKEKYLTIKKTYDPNTGEYTDTTDFDQLRFLHGERTVYIKEWFLKRIYFLDSIYGKNLQPPISSPIVDSWNQNKAERPSSGAANFTTKISGSSRMLFKYTYDQSQGSFWIDPNEINASLVLPTGQTIVYLYANKFITSFDKFKGFPWTNLASIDLPLLESLDLSNIINIEKQSFFTGGIVYNPATGKGLKNIRNLNLSGVKLIGDNAQAYTLDISGCEKLQSLNLSNSTITEVKYSDTAVLKYLNLSGTEITKLNLNNQAFLETILIDGCNKLTEITINNCNKLKSLIIPTGVTKVNISNCDSLESLIMVYQGGSLVSNLISVVVDNCSGLKIVDLTGQNHPGLSVKLLGAWNLETLKLRSIKTKDITLPTLSKFSTLKYLDISYTDISSLKYGTSLEQADYLDLSNFINLDDIQANSCNNLVKVVCPNNKENPIDLNTYSFSGCGKLERIYGHFRLKGSGIFKGCTSLSLNLETTYQEQGFVDVINGVITPKFLIGDNVCNLSFISDIKDLTSNFESCNINYGDFKYIMFRIPSSVTIMESIFKDCKLISGDVWQDMLSVCPNVLNLKDAFNGTNLKGILNSRSSNFNINQKATYGLLDFIPKVKNLEGTFSNTLIQWIDNNFFRKGFSNLEITNINNIFSGCRNLKAAEDVSTDLIGSPVEGSLNSLNFFEDLLELSDIFPKNPFSGCGLIKMKIFSIENDTFLFHTKRQVSANMILDGSLYSGIDLIGEIKVNVFGGITNTISVNGINYNIPKFTSISSPFSQTSGNVKMDLSQMSKLFFNIRDIIRQAVNLLDGISLIGSRKLPNDIFSGCIVLNSISGFCKNKDFDNDGEIYNFPPEGLFNDCVALKDISKLFAEDNKLKLSLIGEGFKNCQLTNVSEAFAATSLFGVIPYRLFYMEYNNNGVRTLRNTIELMTNVFRACWCLGYDSSRTIDTTKVINNNGDKLNWYNRVVLFEGNKVDFRLNVKNLKKTYNFDRDDRVSIPNPNYISDPSHRPPDYDINTPETIINPEYNPGELAYDSWYLDGFGLEGATFLDGDESDFISRMKQYTDYDVQQKEVILAQNELELYIPTKQNYAIPTDLFRYCSNNIKFTSVLQDITWKKNVLKENLQTGEFIVETTEDIEGLSGRIPCKLLQANIELTQVNELFYNTRFDAFVGFNGKLRKRGINYPFDLFKYNKNLRDTVNVFKGTMIPVGVDINTDLFYNNKVLSNISGLWSDTKFDWREANLQDLGNNPTKYSQIDFANIFKANNRIINASGLFQVSRTGVEYLGLYKIDRLLLENCYNINNIQNMFYNNSEMVGEVPEFNDSVYVNIRAFNGYLEGCAESNILNAANLQDRLRPSGWSQQQ